MWREEGEEIKRGARKEKGVWYVFFESASCCGDIVTELLRGVNILSVVFRGRATENFLAALM